jgi:hypothetical protein
MMGVPLAAPGEPIGVGSTARWFGLLKREEMPIDFDKGLHSARSLLKYVRCLPVGWEALCADRHCN